MAKQIIKVGTIANDGTGDTLRDAGVKINANFTELYGTSHGTANSLINGAHTVALDNNGDLILATDGGVVFDRNNTSIRVGMGFHIASGEGISLEAVDQTDPMNLTANNWYFSPTGEMHLPLAGKISNNANSWYFGANGNLTLPIGTVIGGSDPTQGITLTTNRGTLLLGNTPERIGSPQHFHIMANTQYIGGYDQPLFDLFLGSDFNYVQLPGYDADQLGVDIGTNNLTGGLQYKWRFGTDGTFTLPAGGDIVDSVGQTVLGFEASYWSGYTVLSSDISGITVTGDVTSIFTTGKIIKFSTLVDDEYTVGIVTYDSGNAWTVIPLVEGLGGPVDSDNIFFEVAGVNEIYPSDTMAFTLNNNILTLGTTGIYSPSTPGDWNGTAPVTLAEALDRLATVVKALNSNTGA